MRTPRLNAARRSALVLAALLSGVALMAGTGVSRGDLNSRQRALQQAIGSDSGQISAYHGRLADLESRLTGIESSLAIQRALLERIVGQLAAARARLASLQAGLVQDRQVLARQLVAQYESPAPDLVSVVVQARGFDDLLERVHDMRRVAQRNATVIRLVARAKRQVAAQATRLAAARTRQERVTAAVQVERDQVAGLRLAVLARERVAVRDRSRRQVELRRVQRQLAALQARAAAAQRASFAVQGSGGTGFAPDGGQYGFFPASGTNYSVGEEPEIAARLDRLGRALHLHLIGLSGYRSPQHSVEVGGFADDPHTRGDASDTPGVEGVPESTLLQFGLTRPFPGPAEADHIQLA
jgi:peptidoglycan hydrolase CwlO-like protein